MPRKNPSKSQYRKLAAFCWQRAKKATTPKRRTFWFDQFDVAAEFQHHVPACAYWDICDHPECSTGCVIKRQHPAEYAARERFQSALPQR